MVVARNEHGEVDFSVFSYVRYLNQLALEDSYTDSFGRTQDLRFRHDVQLQKVNLSYRFNDAFSLAGGIGALWWMPTTGEFGPGEHEIGVRVQRVALPLTPSRSGSTPKPAARRRRSRPGWRRRGSA